MSLKNDIEKLEKECAAILNKCDNLSSVNKYYQHVVDGVLSMIDDNTNAEDIESLVNKALAESAVKNQKAWQRQIMNLVRDNIQKTQTFYKDRVNAKLDNLYQQTLKRKEVARISKLFSDNIRVANKAMKQGIIEETIKEIESGLLDSMRLRKNLEKKAGLPKHHAYTNSKMAVSAIAQEARNKVAEDAGLDYFYYYGEIIANSRPFCRICINKTYSRKQIDMMSNGMLDPVMTFKGGYRCIHSLLGVNPAWDDDIKPVQGNTVRKITFGNMTIKVIATDKQAARLVRQERLSGYYRFSDAKSNDSGYVAIHDTWINKYGTTSKNKLTDMERELALAERMSEITGDEIVLRKDTVNNRGGDVDLIWEGIECEVKSPVKARLVTIMKSVTRKKKGQDYQSENYIVDLPDGMDDNMISEVERLFSNWKEDHSDKSIWIINKDKMTEVK